MFIDPFESILGGNRSQLSFFPPSSGIWTWATCMGGICFNHWIRLSPSNVHPLRQITKIFQTWKVQNEIPNFPRNVQPHGKHYVIENTCVLFSNCCFVYRSSWGCHHKIAGQWLLPEVCVWASVVNRLLKVFTNQCIIHNYLFLTTYSRGILTVWCIGFHDCSQPQQDTGGTFT